MIFYIFGHVISSAEGPVRTSSESTSKRLTGITPIFDQSKVHSTNLPVLSPFPTNQQTCTATCTSGPDRVCAPCAHFLIFLSKKMIFYIFGHVISSTDGPVRTSLKSTSNQLTGIIPISDQSANLHGHLPFGA